MDKSEARTLLVLELEKIAKLSYTELAVWIENKHVQVCEPSGCSGTKYCIEIEAFWDNKPEAVIRVLGSIDDGGLWSAMMPVCSGFLISPDGTIEIGWNSPIRT